MHLLTTPLVYRLLTFKASPRYTKLVGGFLAILFTVVIVTHMIMDEFLLHAVTFGLAIYIIASGVLRIIPQQVPDPVIKKKLRNIAIFGCCKCHRGLSENSLTFNQRVLLLATLSGCWTTGSVAS